MRRFRVPALVILAALLAIPAVALTAAPGVAHAAAGRTVTRHVLHTHPVHFGTRQYWAKMKKTRTRRAAYAQGSGDLQYGGGPVQHDPVSYIIFWGPNWPSDNAAQVVQNYFNDLSGTSFENITTQYYDYSSYINNDESVGGVWFDTSTPPTDSSCGGPTVEDSSLQSEVQNAINANGWAADGNNGLYLVYTPSGYYINDGTGACSAPAGGYCAYHNWSNSDGVAYAAMPYPGSGCQVSSSPNGDVNGDSEVNLTSHEEFETITDPQPSSGWVDSAGYEIGDKCAWDFSAGYTYLNNGGTFEVQTEYSDASSSCVNSY